MKKCCERCGAGSPRPNASPYCLFSYCAVCSADLCDDCMEKGHCGHVPALRDEGDAEELTSTPEPPHGR